MAPVPHCEVPGPHLFLPVPCGSDVAIREVRRHGLRQSRPARNRRPDRRRVDLMLFVELAGYRAVLPCSARPLVRYRTGGDIH